MSASGGRSTSLIDGSRSRRGAAFAEASLPGSVPAAASPGVPRVQLLVFRLEGREHAVPVGHVIEVLRMVAVTSLPEAPPWVAGVINLRGRVIPVIRLRDRLRMPPRATEISTPIIVVEAAGVAAGLVADEVVEVLALTSDEMEAPDARTVPAPAVSALARHGERLVVVLDTERILEGSGALDAGGHREN